MANDFGPWRSAWKTAVLRFSGGSLAVDGVLYREDNQGQLVQVPETDPSFEAYEQWKRERVQRAAATRPNRAARRSAARKKSGSARRKQKKGVRHG